MKTILHEVGRDEHFKLWHALSDEDNMIIYFHSDGGSIVTGDKVYPIKNGSLCFVGAGKYHYTMPDDPAVYDRSKMFFDSQLLRGIISLVTDGRSYSRFTFDSIVYAEIPEYERDSVNLAFEETSRDGSGALSVASISRLIHLLEKYSAGSAVIAHGALNDAIDYVNKNIFKEITIDDICSEVHISKYYFCRRFKETMGMTVMDYVLKTRIALAKNMLERENVSISEVSDKCGFSSVSYFCRVFKESVGVSPLKYRKKFD